ncbi:hypothetical protein [Acrocarpospora pleiomorpha]|nr:hypothetical protein [Acrocarpospora pleiomorpha]
MLLLDVDGVLNPSRRSSLAWRRYTGIVDGEPYKILLDPRHGPHRAAPPAHHSRRRLPLDPRRRQIRRP